MWCLPRQMLPGRERIPIAARLEERGLMNWTDERVELLRKLWSEGLSASQIAAQLGGVSRNAVIGKVHRLKLSSRGRANTAPVRQKKNMHSNGAVKVAPRQASVVRTMPASVGATA